MNPSVVQEIPVVNPIVGQLTDPMVNPFVGQMNTLAVNSFVSPVSVLMNHMEKPEKIQWSEFQEMATKDVALPDHIESCEILN